jgi:hypothetical protein
LGAVEAILVSRSLEEQKVNYWRQNRDEWLIVLLLVGVRRANRARNSPGREFLG